MPTRQRASAATIATADRLLVIQASRTRALADAPFVAIQIDGTLSNVDLKPPTIPVP